MIIKNINEKYDNIQQEQITKTCFSEAKQMGINPASILRIVPYGSFNYNLSDEKSDLDLVVVYVPTFLNLFYNYENEKNVIKEQKENKYFGDIIFIDIYNYLKQVKKGNLRYIETLFSSNIIFEKKFFKKFLDKTRYMYLLHDPEKVQNYIVGYIDQKAHALTHPYPSKLDLIKKYGYDLKNYSHVLRMENFAEKYLILLDYLYKFGFDVKFLEHKFNPFLIQNNRQEMINPYYLINLKRHNLIDFPKKENVLNHMLKIRRDIKQNEDFETNPFCILFFFKIKKLEEELLEKCFYFVKGI